MGVKLLSKLDGGEKGRIVKIRGAAGVHRLLFDLGLFVGRTISVEKNGMALQTAPIEVRVKARVFSMKKEVADNMQLEVA